MMLVQSFIERVRANMGASIARSFTTKGCRISKAVVRLDHRYSMESVFLEGENDKVRAFADQVLAERGINFGSINFVGVDPDDDHDDEHDHSHHDHSHLLLWKASVRYKAPASKSGGQFV